MQNARLGEVQDGIKIAKKNINNLKCANDTTLMAEREEELKSLLMNIKKKSKKAGLKQHSKNQDHEIWSHHFMANKWGKMERVADVFSWSPKSLQTVTAAMIWKDTCFLGGKLCQN